MKSAQLTKRNPSGSPGHTDEVILHCTAQDIRVLFDALDLYCTEHPDSRHGKTLYHELGWNTHYFPKEKNCAKGR